MYIVFFTGRSMGQRFDDVEVMAHYIKEWLRDNPKGECRVQLFI